MSAYRAICDADAPEHGPLHGEIVFQTPTAQVLGADNDGGSLEGQAAPYGVNTGARVGVHLQPVMPANVRCVEGGGASSTLTIDTESEPGAWAEALASPGCSIKVLSFHSNRNSPEAQQDHGD